MTQQQTEDITIDDLHHFWAADGLPVFFANRDDICDIVENMGFQIYYLLAKHLEEVKVNNGNVKKDPKATTTTYNQQTVTKTTTQWFKVVNNFVGRSIDKCLPPLEDSFIKIAPSALYTMPPIPLVIVDKLDQFFRLVDAQHGTESIVMLTYDMNKEGPKGWGILVPDQQNTAAHCNYDPHSIAEMKPDNVMIVGSVHSHPKMAAYASGTDHADQADFDGIHITYGWQKSVNNGATQYHIELQMAGSAYTLQPEDVFEDFTLEQEPDPEVVEWTSKVKKALPPLMGGTSTSSIQRPSRQSPPPANGASDRTRTGTLNLKSLDLKWIEYSKKLPFTKTIPENSILVLEVDVYGNKEQICAICSSIIDEYCLFDGCCDVCLVPTVHKGTSVTKILEEVSYYAYQADLDINAPVYLICRDSDKDYFLMSITSDSLSKYVSQNSYVSENDGEYQLLEDIEEENEIDLDPISDDKEYLLCCGIHIDDEHTCTCELRITPEVALDFDTDTRSLKIYDSSSQCVSCEYYHDPICPSYRNLIEMYARNSYQTVDKIEKSEIPKIDGDGCEHFKWYESPLSGAYYE